MAVTQESDGNSKKSVEELTRHCGGEGADPGPCGLTQQNNSKGPLTRPKVIGKDKCGTIRSQKLGGKSIIDSKSDRLSDIDDIEVVGYLNTKEEIHRKRILWEAMNEKYIKVKKQKQAAERKKVASDKKATKTTEKLEPERRSSRINYDALKYVGGDLQESRESAQTSSGSDSYAHGTQNSAHGKISHVMHGSNESWSEEDEDEDQHDSSYEGETHYQYGDEDLYDDFDS